MDRANGNGLTDILFNTATNYYTQRSYPKCVQPMGWDGEWFVYGNETDPSHSLTNVIDNVRKNLTSQKNYVYSDWCLLPLAVAVSEQ